MVDTMGPGCEGSGSRHGGRGLDGDKAVPEAADGMDALAAESVGRVQVRRRGM